MYLAAAVLNNAFIQGLNRIFVPLLISSGFRDSWKFKAVFDLLKKQPESKASLEKIMKINFGFFAGHSLLLYVLAFLESWVRTWDLGPWETTFCSLNFMVLRLIWNVSSFSPFFLRLTFSDLCFVWIPCNS